MKKIITILIISIFSVLVALTFNVLFLHYPVYTYLDQFLLVFLLAWSIAYILYEIWIKKPVIHFDWNFSSILFNRTAILENGLGIGIALFFFILYLYYGIQLNIFGARQVDNLFDADIGSWIHRISTVDIQDFPMRGPHPFAYFIFRPIGLFLNFFTTTPSFSAILLNTLVGALSVFVTWLFIKRQFENKIYATLIASLLGLTTAHIFFGSIVETYIFSAFVLILFFFYLQTDSKSSIASLIFTSVLTFGITFTNFAQNIIGFAIARPRFNQIIRFASWVFSISIILTFIHAAVYPASKLFFLSAGTKVERGFFVNTFNAPDWRFEGRNLYLTRTVFLYSVVAPKPFILTEEVGSVIPEFRFFKISPRIFHQANYRGMGQILVGLWMLMFFMSGITFLWNFIKTKELGMPFSFLVCIGFNFIVHFFYGQELFLYSPNWAYALIFFTAFGLAPFARNRFFQAGMTVFLILLAYNQWQFMDLIVQAISKFAAN